MADVIDGDQEARGETTRGRTAPRRRVRDGPEQAYGAMLRCLARREHSELELRRKLARKCLSTEDIDDIIDRLQDDNLQSDARFAEDFIHSMMERGYGYGRIYSSLRERGIDKETITECLTTDEQTWFDLVCHAMRKRFGDDDPINYHGSDEERAAWLRRASYLQRRGFARDAVAKALNGKPFEE